DVLFAELRMWLTELGRLDELMSAYVNELARFSRMRKVDLTDYDAAIEGEFTFDMKAQEDADFAAPASATRLGAKQRFWVSHTSSQREQLADFVKEFGRSHDGRGKMLMR